MLYFVTVLLYNRVYGTNYTSEVRAWRYILITAQQLKYRLRLPEPL